MKKLIIIFSLLGIGICSFGQVVEKWVDTDSLNAEKIVLNGKELDNDTIDFAIRSDSSGFADSSQYSDTSGFSLVATNSDSSRFSDTAAYILPQPQQESDTIYVATDGNDVTGDGSQLNPYASIYRAMDDIELSIPGEADVLIDVDTGTYIPNADLFNKLTTYDIDGVLRWEGKWDTLATGLTFTRDVDDRFTCQVSGLGYTPSWDTLRGYFVLNTVAGTAYPIAHNDTTAILCTNEWDSYDDCSMIVKPATIWDCATVNPAPSNYALDGLGVFWFQRFYLELYNANQRFGNDNFDGTRWRNQDCYFDFTNTPYSSQYYIQGAKEAWYYRCFFDINEDDLLDYRGFINLNNETELYLSVVANRSKTFVDAYWNAVALSGDATIGSSIIRNFPFGVRIGGLATLTMNRSIRFSDIGCAFKIYTEGATVTMASPYGVSSDSLNYYFMTRYATTNINLVMTEDLELFGKPLISQRVPDDINGTWKGKSLQSNAIDTNIIWSPFDNLLIRLPADDPSLYDLKVADSLDVVVELIVRDTSIVDLIEAHGGGSGGATIFSNDFYAFDDTTYQNSEGYFSDFSHSFQKSFESTWTQKLTSETWTGIAMSEDGQHRTATAFSEYIYVSHDYGDTWTAKATSGDWERVSMSADGRYQAAILYTGVNLGYIYVSSDTGNTWIQETTYQGWEGVEVSYTGKIMLGGGGASNTLEISTDYGQNWSDITPTAGQTWSEIGVSASGQYITACAYGGQIYVSDDFGSSFTQKLPVKNWFGADLSFTGQFQIVTASGEGKVYVSHNYGADWDTVSVAGTNKSGCSISLSGKYMVVSEYGDDIFFSNDYGVNWVSVSTAANYRKVAISGNGTHASTIVTSGYVYNAVPVITNNPSIDFSGNISLQNQDIDYVMGDTLADPQYVRDQIAAFEETDPVYNSDLSRDIYETWTQSGSSGTWKTVAVSGNTGQYQIKCGISDYIYTSDDYGVSWTSRSAAGARTWYWCSVSNDGKYMSAVAQSNYIYTSDDYGATWTARSAAGSRSWTSIGVSGSGQYQVATSTSAQIYVSADYGATWNTYGLSGNYWAAAVSSTGEYMIAARTGGYAYVSSDYGLNWTQRGNYGDYYSAAISYDGKYMVSGRQGYPIQISNDYGVTWSASGSASRTWISVDISSDGKIITGSTLSNPLTVSIDTGSTFTDVYESGQWRQLSINNTGTVAAAARYNSYIYLSGITFDFNYSPSLSSWENQPFDDDILTTRGYVNGYFSGSLTDGSPTDAEITAIIGRAAMSVGPYRKFLIKDTDGTGLYYKVLSNGTSWIYFPGQTGSTAL